MKRKRFIKLLGSYGLTRNTANLMAQATIERGGTYEHALAYFKHIRAEMERILRQAIKDTLLYGEANVPLGDLCCYFPPYSGKLDFELKPVRDEQFLRFAYAIDTAPIGTPPMQWLKENPHLGGGGHV